MFGTQAEILYLFMVQIPLSPDVIFNLYINMSKYKKLKIQLASYESLYELTKAIQLVALSKLKTVQDQRKKIMNH